MPDDGFEEYLKLLYDREIEPAVQQFRLTRHHRLEWAFEFEYPITRLARANNTLRPLNSCRMSTRSYAQVH
jgi:hypothetical protein